MVGVAVFVSFGITGVARLLFGADVSVATDVFAAEAQPANRRAERKITISVYRMIICPQ
jgi:hypothetical protein